MFELTNNSEAEIHFRRPDLKLNFDLPAGESVVITGRQAMAVELYMNDMDISLAPSSEKEPDEHTQSVEYDREGAVRGVAMSGLVDFNAQSLRPENRKDFYNNSAPESDEDKVNVAAESARLAKSYETKSKQALEQVQDEKAKAKAEESIKKEGEQAEKSAKDAPVTKEVDLGVLVPSAGSEPDKAGKEKAEKAEKAKK